VSDIIRHVTIRGRVQGVGYRAWTEHEAKRRGLAGWVRNRRDGAVEALFSGPEHVVRDMIEACRAGPRSAKVEAIEEREAGMQELALRGEENFAVLSTL
jgi:acylphosphatase